MKNIFYIFAFFLIVSGCRHQSDPGVNPENDWKKLTLREKIGQTVMITAMPDLQASVGSDSLALFLEKYPVGGFFMANWIIFKDIDANHKEKHLRQLIQEYLQFSKYPPFIVEDFEGGLGHALPGYTKMPAGVLLGAADSVQLAFQVGEAVARECRSLGINWVLHPVADLNLNPLNPVTNVRSVSKNPDQVIKLLAAQIAGLQQNGVAATIKHFPGDGVSDLDQHLTTTYNTLETKAWWSLHGKVFSELIDSGVYSVMTGHIGLPHYQQENGENSRLPATLSPVLTTSLLKQKMGFDGVVVSDALNMGGLQGYYPSQVETEIASFLAGTDVLLWPSLAYIDTLEARILRGQIPLQRLDEAVERIWEMKRKLGLFEKISPPDSLAPEVKNFAENTAKSVARAAITVLDGVEELPLDTTQHRKILWVAVAPDQHTGSAESFRPVVELLKNYGFEVDLRHNLSYYENSPADQLKYDKIIFAFSRHPHDPIGSLQLQSAEALTAWMANMLPREKVIVISFGDPYVISRYMPRAAIQIDAYTNIEVMQQTVGELLLGQIHACGRNPLK